MRLCKTQSGWIGYAFLLCGFVALGCRSAAPPVIAVIPETTAQELWESEHAGAQLAARHWGWRVYWNAPSREDDIPRQIQIVNQEIGRGVYGLVLSPDHAIALIAPVRSALAHDIPTVILGSRLESLSNSRLHMVLNDEAMDGVLAARRAELYLTPSSTLAILGVNPNLPGSITRANALEDEVRAADPSVRIVEKRLISFGFAEGEEMAEDVIRARPGLRVIVSLNVNETRGAYEALLDVGALGRIRLIGCDQDLDLVHHLRTGGIDALVAENTYRMGVDAIDLIHRIRAKQSPVSDEVIEPALITRENVDSASIQQMLRTDWIAD